jgi:Protein of unknown function (DUF3305)
MENRDEGCAPSLQGGSAVSAAKPHARIPVGVVVERRKAASPWIDAVWRAVAVLGGVPDAAPWTVIAAGEDVTTFYVGSAEIELYRTEAEHYRTNLDGAEPSVWVALRPTGTDPPYALFAVTADPAEGESFTQAGGDVVDAVPMPAAVREIVAAFVAEHHVAEPHYRRTRTDARDESREPLRKGRKG